MFLSCFFFVNVQLLSENFSFIHVVWKISFASLMVSLRVFPQKNLGVLIVQIEQKAVSLFQEHFFGFFGTII